MKGAIPHHMTTRTSIDSSKKELRDRVEAKQKRLEARLQELKADTREQSREERGRIEAQLSEVSKHVREGWDRISEQTSRKLNDWLKNN